MTASDTPVPIAEDARPPLAMRTLYALYRGLASALFPVLGPVRVYGEHNIPRQGPVIFAPNHMSYLDPPVVGWKSHRYIWAIGKKELLELPLMGAYFKAMGVIPVDQKGGGARATIRVALEQLAKGRAILIFPEGTRMRGPLGPALPGVSLIARKSGAPVVPVLLTGTHRSVSPDHRGLHRGPITCTYGPPFRLDPNEKGNLEADARHIMRAIADLRAITPNAHPEIREEDLPPPRKSRKE